MSRTAQLKYGSNTVELGLIGSISDSISASVLPLTIPMLKAEEQFGMDNGTTESITITSQHINRDSMTNADWMKAMIQAVNRWQAETDGCRFQYVPDDGVSDYISEYDTNGYISNMTLKWNAGIPEVIQATTTLKVGSMTGGYSSGTSPVVDMQIQMSDINGNWHQLCYKDSSGDWTSAVQSLELTGGFDQPFESIKVKIPRRKLEDISSAFIQTDGIKVGTNIIRLVGAMGWGDFIISSVKSDRTDYTITAYSVAELFNASTLPQNYGAKRIARVTTTKYVQIGVSIPARGIVADVTYPDESGNPQTIRLYSDNPSFVTNCLLDISGTVSITLNALPATPAYSFVEWSDGSRDTSRVLEISSGMSLGCSITDGEYIIRSTPPEIQGGVIEKEDTVDTYENYPIYNPLDIIKNILSTGIRYPLGNSTVTKTYTQSASQHNGKLYINTSSGDSANWTQTSCYFPQSMNAWYVLQLCAYAMNCKIHFSDGDCYITGIGYISSMSHPSINLSSSEDSTFLIGTPVLGSSKSENIVNTIPYKFGTFDTVISAKLKESNEYVFYTNTASDQGSIAYYGVKSSSKVFQGVRRSSTDSQEALNIATAMIRFSKAGGQSITVEEIESKNGQWVQRFGNECFPSSISDELNDVSMTVNTPMGTDYITLGLREYTRKFPECTTTYSFGPQNPSNLALKVSSLESTINNS